MIKQWTFLVLRGQVGGQCPGKLEEDQESWENGTLETKEASWRREPSARADGVNGYLDFCSFELF